MAEALGWHTTGQGVVVSIVRLRSYACTTSLCMAPISGQPGQLGIPNAQVHTPTHVCVTFPLTSSFHLHLITVLYTAREKHLCTF
jgi:hypothetical protein